MKNYVPIRELLYLRYDDLTIPYYNWHGIKFHLKVIKCRINHEINKRMNQREDTFI